MSKKMILVLLSVAGAAALSGCSSNNKQCCTEQPAAAAAPATTREAAAPLPPQTPPLTYETAATGSVTAAVTAIDHANRLITLRGPAGHTETYRVGPQVQRLNEVSVGDNVTLAYSVSLLAELRAPTSEESNRPIEYYNVSTRSGGTPAGGEGIAVRVVTTVDNIDLPRMLVTLKGPLGNRLVARARKEENIRKLRLGDTVIVTYTEGVAMSLEKAN